MSDLFGHLATRFGRSPEDLATEGLCYVLNHRVAGNAFAAFVNERAEADLPENLTFRTQEAATDGDGQPDMRGASGDGTTRLLVESKFWAGLTQNQPNGYLLELNETPGSVLLFLVPHPRREYIWPKIRDAAAEEFDVETNDGYRVSLANGTTLVLCSWRDALNAVEAGVQAEGGMRGILEDIRQVQSLCERYSREGFVPLRGDELGQDVGKRVWQIFGLAKDLQNRFGPEWEVSSSPTTTRYRYGYKAHLFGFKTFVAIHYFWWSKRGNSPIWVRIFAKTRQRRDEVIHALQPDIEAFPHKDKFPNQAVIPLPLKLGVERDEVLSDLARQLDDIAEQLEAVLMS